MGRNQSVSSICDMPKEDAINGGMRGVHGIHSTGLAVWFPLTKNIAHIRGNRKGKLTAVQQAVDEEEDPAQEK